MPPPQMPHKNRLGRLLPLLITLILAVFVLAQYQNIYDWLQLRDYQAPAAVAALADATGMTTKSRHDFYVNHPQIQTQNDFNQSCPDNGGEQTIILGCYISHQRGIYIYQVSDPELKGVEEVTAAHEMLHSAYDRLSSKDRTYVNGLLQDYYDHDLHDQRLLDVIAAYKNTEPNDLVNEMHSIFGTEVAQLPPALEDYYKQYFTNRQTVTDLAGRYQAAFTSRKDQIAAYDAQLKQLKAQIDANQVTLESESADLSSRRQQLSALLQSGNTSAYNAQVDSFNNAVNQYNALITQTKGLINQYNVIVQRRNAVAVETQNLAQELNSHLQTQTAQ